MWATWTGFFSSAASPEKPTRPEKNTARAVKPKVLKDTMKFLPEKKERPGRRIGLRQGV
jgi:hypothetical protein